MHYREFGCCILGTCRQVSFHIGGRQRKLASAVHATRLAHSTWGTHQLWPESCTVQQAEKYHHGSAVGANAVPATLHTEASGQHTMRADPFSNRWSTVRRHTQCFTRRNTLPAEHWLDKHSNKTSIVHLTAGAQRKQHRSKHERTSNAWRAPWSQTSLGRSLRRRRCRFHGMSKRGRTIAAYSHSIKHVAGPAC